MKTTRVLSVLLVLLAVGCGKADSNKFPVTGKVTYRGKPLPVGLISFVPESRNLQLEAALIDANGCYQLEAAPGKYLVQVQMNARLRGEPAPEEDGIQINIPEVDWLIPEKYGNFQSSGLEAVVEPKETNPIDFPMQ